MRYLKVENGIVKNIAIFDELPDEDGWTVDPGGVERGWEDNGNGTFSKPDSMKPTLEEAKEAKIETLQSRFAAETGGLYSSTILGTTHHYDLNDWANRNLTALTVSAKRNEAAPDWKRKIKCLPDGQNKGQRIEHTAEQIQDLNDEINDWIDGRLDYLDALVDQVEAVEVDITLDAALAEIAAIVW